MNSELKIYRTKIERGQRIVVDTDEIPGDAPTEIPTDVQVAIDAIAPTIRAYVDSCKEVLRGRLAALRPLLPSFLADPCNLFVIVNRDGIAIRYERTEEKDLIHIGYSGADLATSVNQLSEQLITLHETPDFTPNVENGFRFAAKGHDGDPAVGAELFSMLIAFDCVRRLPEKAIVPPEKPFCLASITNKMQIELWGVQIPSDSPSPTIESTSSGKRVVFLSEIELPVGWECIQIFPECDPDQWKPEFAPLWAERDLLAAASSARLREDSLKTLDPYSDARREAGRLLAEFKSLLDSNPDREETLQAYLRTRPELLAPSHVRMWPKLSLGKHVTDFVFLDANGEYVLVELERSQHKLFKRDGHKTAALNHALEQISDWERYIEDNLTTVQRELGLTNITASSKGLVVIGRSSTLTDDNRRKLQLDEKTSPNRKVLTYDDVLKNAAATFENLLGPISQQPGTTRMYYLR